MLVLVSQPRFNGVGAQRGSSSLQPGGPVGVGAFPLRATTPLLTQTQSMAARHCPPHTLTSLLLIAPLAVDPSLVIAIDPNPPPQSMPAPTFAEVSVRDGTRLEIQVCHAPAAPEEERQHDPPQPRVVAVILHPWGPLGGQCRDPVVAAVFRRLLSLEAPTTVARFNARGVGKSESRPTSSSSSSSGPLWQAASALLPSTPSQRNERDAEDLVDVVRHVLAEAARVESCDRRRRLWLLGFSHGSLVASLALPMLRERLPSIDPHAELAGVVAIAPPLGLVCSVFLGASAAFEPFCAGGGSSLARLALLGTRDNFTSVAQLRAALANGFEFCDEEEEEAGAGRRRGGGGALAPARARLLAEADHFFFGRAGEVAEAAAAFVAEVEEAEGEARWRESRGRG